MLFPLGDSSTRVLVAQLSDDDISSLCSALKRVKNPRAHWSCKPGHKQRNYRAESDDGTQFHIFQRVNLKDERNFSSGLALIQKGGKSLILMRYNGSNHLHGDILFRCHIHRATEEAQAQGKKIDSRAEETERYRTVEGALACLVYDCSVQGLDPEHYAQTQGQLFNGP